jgi:hypothetical protein
MKQLARFAAVCLTESRWFTPEIYVSFSATRGGGLANPAHVTKEKIRPQK